MKKLVVFDADGVLTNERSSWLYVHKGLGKDIVRKCAKLKKLYFNSPKMTYETWAKEDVELWGNVDLEKINKILNKVKLMKGAEETCKILKERGYLLAIISTGINLLLKRIKKKLNIDYLFCNEIYERDGKLSVKINVSLDKNTKDKVLKELIKSIRIKKENIVVVGDSEDDYPMMKLAGFSILFNPQKDNDLISAKRFADVVVESKDLKDILQYFEK